MVSASLDQTVRVWDTTGLRKKTVRGAPSAMVSPVQPRPSPVSEARSLRPCRSHLDLLSLFRSIPTYALAR